MSREEAMNALIESGMELRRDDIELGKRLESERIVNLLAGKASIARLDPNRRDEAEYLHLLIGIIKGKQK